MTAPTRRAAPVTSAVLPCNSGATAAPASVIACVMGPDYDGISAALNPAATFCARAGAQRAARRAHPRGTSGGGRLAVVRALHGARALCAGTRLLQRGQRQARPRRGLRDRARGFGSVLPLHRAAVRRGAGP